jgi:hypothetical protein
MISYHLVAFDHNTEQFSLEPELIGSIMKDGSCFTEEGSERDDLDSDGLKHSSGWHTPDIDPDVTVAEQYGTYLIKQALEYINTSTDKPWVFYGEDN